MGKRLKLAGKCAAFICVLCFCLTFTYRLIVPKFFFDTTWPTTSTYLGFYEMEENTVDVLFFGSSHAASFFLPQELYNGYGITSYNLGCEQQNLVTSYFWLKEALRYQQPKAVVLDCYMLFPYSVMEPLNTAESCTRKAMDFMKWSSVKKEAVETICALDENQSLLSYYFPNIRYHARWKELSEDDFVFSDMAEHYELMGYAPLAGYCGIEGYSPFEVGTAEDAADTAEMVPLMREYLENMTELCQQQEIQLLLVKTPTTAENLAKYNVIQKYAKEHGLAFLDFNEKSLYEKTGFCFQTDNHDAGHGNLWGAQKVTQQIGRTLAELYGLGSRIDGQWEAPKSYYEGICKDCELVHMADIDEYLAALQDKRYSVFISAKDECSSCLKPSTIEKLRGLGLQAALQGEYRCSYLAVVSDGEVVERIGYDILEAEGTVRDGLVMYSIASAGYERGNVSSIVIGKAESSKNGRGLNIVVYNNDTKKIVDSVCFDTFAEENLATR